MKRDLVYPENFIEMRPVDD